MGGEGGSASPAAVSLQGEKQPPPSPRTHAPPPPPGTAPPWGPAPPPHRRRRGRGVRLRLSVVTFVPRRPPARCSPGPRRGRRKGTGRNLPSALGPLGRPQPPLNSPAMAVLTAAPRGVRRARSVPDPRRQRRLLGSAQLGDYRSPSPSHTD